LATKKGVILTVGILGAITAASFLFWLVPQTTQTVFFVSDYESNLNGIVEIHETIITEIDEEFQNMLNEITSPDEYKEIAEISSSQLKSEIIHLIGSNPPEDWNQSYFNYIESLKKSNTYIRETVVVANMIENNDDGEKIQELIEKIEELKKDSKSLAMTSSELRPWFELIPFT